MNTSKIIPRFSVEKAHKMQLQLSKQIIQKDRLPKKVKLVAGVDVAYVKGMSIGAVAVLDYDSLKLIESETACYKTRFPYIPTLLSFRELPPALMSIQKLTTQPDVFLVDGQGLAHPYRCGFASHLGLTIKKPTVGVAKSRLIGEPKEFTKENVAFLEHKGEVVGATITAIPGCKPIYVSVGHMVSLEAAIKIVNHCLCHSHIPEPIRKAHEIATLAKRKIK